MEPVTKILYYKQLALLYFIGIGRDMRMITEG
jgi:hypothetical protein